MFRDSAEVELELRFRRGLIIVNYPGLGMVGVYFVHSR
jgi:hypothetical protein